ncbi:DUF1772 domain-containing protein [Rhodococcus fascians]|nr:DUF1772 domain-containing protein [Rhodococcus fascians]MBY4418556.1 DUF1772 domain-containing protein [Rhodococcus fascians]
MIDKISSIATLVASVGCGLVAGVMLAFSVSVLPGLASLPVPDAIAAMQRANAAILNPLFLTLFVGTALTCSLATVLAITTEGGRSTWVGAGAALYVVGCFVVTVAFNVPLNDALAAVDPASPSGADIWRSFTSNWTRWNTVRIISSTAACAVLILGQGRSALG